MPMMPYDVVMKMSLLEDMLSLTVTNVTTS